MSNYTKTTDFEAKDSLPSGDSGKIIKGAEFETEFDAISTAVATKADAAGATLTGTTSFENLSDGTITVTAFVDEDNMASDSATLVPTQQSVKAYVDSQVTAQDLDFQADSGGALSIDLDSEALTLTGGTGIDTSGALNEVTFAIDSTVATLTGTQTLTNKTLTAPTISGNLTTDGNIDGRDVATDGAKLDGIEANATADQTAAEIRTLVDSATDSNVFTDADHTKLDGIEANATADQTAAEIRTLVDSATDSNVFTDADHTKLDGIEASATADQTDAEIRAAVEAATDSNVFTDADHTKLDGIEASADVTDTANVTAAGALMDSELTSEASVKALNQGVATTDSPTFAGVTVNGTVEFDGLSGTGAVSVTDILDQDDMSSNSATALATQQSIKAYVDSQVATADTLSEVLANGNTTGGTDVAFGDNDKAIFGAGSDLQIYHDGSASYIDDQGTGNLKIKSNGVATQILDGSSLNLAVFNAGNGQAQLYNVNSGTSTIRLATTSTGIDVTGTVTADGLTVDGSGEVNGTFTASRLKTDSGTNTLDIYGYLGLNYYQGDGIQRFYGNGGNRLDINGTTGDISFYEDTGTTAKFFWDSSAESLGIGTTPSAQLHLQNGSTEDVSGSTIRMDLSGINPYWEVQARNGGSAANRQLGFYTSATSGDVLTLTQAGNVGIGRSVPSARLDVDLAATGDIAIFRGSSSDTFTIESDGSGILLDTRNTTAGLTFQIQGSNKMTLDASGNLLVGTTSLAAIDNTPSTTGIGLRPSGSQLYSVNNGGNAVEFRINGTGAVGSINCSGSATSYNTSSDQRLKDNIVDAPSASDDIDAIQVRSFDWKADGSHQKYGMVAQELQSVAPEAVSGDADSDDMMGVDYSKLVPMMLKEIQSLRARVAELESN